VLGSAQTRHLAARRFELPDPERPLAAGDELVVEAQRLAFVVDGPRMRELSAGVGRVRCSRHPTEQAEGVRR